MEVKYIIKRIVKVEQDNDKVSYYKNDTYCDQYTVNLVFHEWSFSIFEANECNTYEFALKIIEALLENLRYDKTVCYQIEKIFTLRKHG